MCDDPAVFALWALQPTHDGDALVWKVERECMGCGERWVRHERADPEVMERFPSIEEWVEYRDGVACDVHGRRYAH